MFRFSLLVVAILLAGAGAGHAQASSDPQAVEPVVYSGTPEDQENCAVDASADAPAPDCVPGGESPQADEESSADYPPDYDYVPDYWEAAPAYVAPSFYLGVSLVPDYWGWPYYAYGWGYGWPYYYGYAAFGFGWPYYGYCCYWGGYWNSYAWHDHGHGHGDHGGWGDHGGHGDHGGWAGHGGSDHGGWGHGGGGHGGNGNPGYPGPYRYLGRGQYANQVRGAGSVAGVPGDRQERVVNTEPARTNYDGSRTGTAENGMNTLAAGPRARTAAFANNPAGAQARYAGRAVLPSASYYAAARSGRNSTSPVDRAANYRGSSAAGNTYARGIAGSTSAGSQGYRAASLPSRGYASANRYSGDRGAMARSATGVAPRGYAGTSSYPQQRYSTAYRAYTGARGAVSSYPAIRGPVPRYSGRGTASSYSAMRGALPAYSGRGAMPSYARGGSYSMGHGSYGGAPVAHSGGGAHGGAHAGNSRGH